MTAPTVLQKLLTPGLSNAAAVLGSPMVGGPVVDAAAASALRTPAELLSAYDLLGEGSPFGATPAQVQYVDVLRFAVDPLMDLQVPPAEEGLTWPTYPAGFLHGNHVVPVWWLERTRVPTGTEFWRVDAKGEQALLSAYAGPALGWRGARGYVPPVQLVGPRAVWQGLDLPAAFEDDPQRVELVSVAETGPEGFGEAGPGIWRRSVSVGDCDRVFELRMTCTWRGVPCRIVQVADGQALLLVLGSRPADVETLDARQLEPGVHEVVAPVAELEDRLGTTRELAR